MNSEASVATLNWFMHFEMSKCSVEKRLPGKPLNAKDQSSEVEENGLTVY